MDEFWVFGYGSLMWNPGFEFVERWQALVRGYRRSLCVRSFVHRGSRENPGLVLGLDRGGACRGTAFRVAPDNRDEVIDYLRARELVTNVYLERHLPLQLPDGRSVRAVAYVVDRAHEQYAGALDALAAARIVNVSVGQSGPNDAYVFNTLAHLKEMGIRDQWLEQVVQEVMRLRNTA
ncbi:gamma-glutamylcyclotransferase [Rhizobium mesosinicum]|uniref:glutathione-specific gamma-glutamylcyclotransferase n=1 Tax=Rhizobium mesosinicum TaxID=335017 RepID=A0ABS7GX55_9HYPH|nr:gamma-glutamylcyclotransferase [Rhizobium mesosinicum]MBW9054361.1 gamma-glutamylcyclotransferase [Rhizobium mesosinicum]